MAVAKFKCRIFDTALALQQFVTSDVNVASVVSVVTNNEGKFILFYLTP